MCRLQVYTLLTVTCDHAPFPLDNRCVKKKIIIRKKKRLIAGYVDSYRFYRDAAGPRLWHFQKDQPVNKSERGLLILARLFSFNFFLFLSHCFDFVVLFFFFVVVVVFFFARPTVPTDRPTFTRQRAMGNEIFFWGGLPGGS